ncbi:ubiquitin carboxyl-terminal hydrolase 37-like [Kryptolebias marmoratus]|nr:ubiquitin carboxyl-terminal hydrolase 37-like [Kryptolebias marmoratus]
MTTEDTTARYSLVSIISHVGSTADSGHYISDGVYRNKDMGDVTDCWLTYDDEDVSPTTGASVCQKRATTAFLLFYEKQH